MTISNKVKSAIAGAGLVATALNTGCISSDALLVSPKERGKVNFTLTDSDGIASPLRIFVDGQRDYNNQYNPIKVLVGPPNEYPLYLQGEISGLSPGRHQIVIFYDQPPRTHDKGGNTTVELLGPDFREADVNVR